MLSLLPGKHRQQGDFAMIYSKLGLALTGICLALGLGGATSADISSAPVAAPSSPGDKQNGFPVRVAESKWAQFGGSSGQFGGTGSNVPQRNTPSRKRERQDSIEPLIEVLPELIPGEPAKKKVRTPKQKDSVGDREVTSTAGAFRLDMPITGLSFVKRALSPRVITNSGSKPVEVLNPYILVHERKMKIDDELLSILTRVAKTGKPLLVVAEDVEGEALATLVVNKLRSDLSITAIKSPGFGADGKAVLEDIAAVTGAKIFSTDQRGQFKNAKLDMLGRAHKVIIEPQATTFNIGPNMKPVVKNRLADLRRQLVGNVTDAERVKILERLDRFLPLEASVR